jgi:hypothetical protein
LREGDFERREDASQRLVEMGAAVIPSILAAVRGTVGPSPVAAAERQEESTSTSRPPGRQRSGESPEVIRRLLGVLEDLLVSADPDAADQADLALEELAISGSHAAVVAGAETILQRHAAVREVRALEALTRLGAEVSQSGGPADPAGVLFLRQGPRVIPGALEPAALVIVLGTEWKGGTDGLRHLRRLQSHQVHQIYTVRGNGVPLEKVNELVAHLPGVSVQERGAYLGISSVGDADVCIVRSVQPGSPAERAGLRAGDIVVALDEQPVLRFYDLVEALKTLSDGTRVTLRVERPGATESLAIPVVLGKWNLSEQGASPSVPLPAP